MRKKKNKMAATKVSVKINNHSVNELVKIFLEKRASLEDWQKEYTNIGTKIQEVNKARQAAVNNLMTLLGPSQKATIKAGNQLLIINTPPIGSAPSLNTIQVVDVSNIQEIPVEAEDNP